VAEWQAATPPCIVFREDTSRRYCKGQASILAVQINRSLAAKADRTNRGSFDAANSVRLAPFRQGSSLRVEFERGWLVPLRSTPLKPSP